MTFLEQLEDGDFEDPIEAFQEAEDKWRETDTDDPLHVYLGMTLSLYEKCTSYPEHLLMLSGRG
jgi:hypothetical protein